MAPANSLRKRAATMIYALGHVLQTMQLSPATPGISSVEHLPASLNSFTLYARPGGVRASGNGARSKSCEGSEKSPSTPNAKGLGIIGASSV